MLKDLQYLVKLQEVDSRIFDLEQSKEEFPRQVEELEKAIQDAQNSVESISKKLEEVEQERKKVDQKITDSKLALERSQERLNSITTNREYDAVHEEIESNRSIVQSGEAKLQAFDTQIEKLSVAKEEAEKQFEEIKAENQPSIDDLKSRIASIDSNIAKEMKERNEISDKINRQYYRTYEHIHTRRKTAKVVSLVDEENKTCTVCFRVLERQLYNKVRSGKSLEICESCGSILILNEKEPQNEGE
ncbi:MAG: zinc ribbon domain-containing protein [Chitinivibrionales bacterium]